MILSASRARSGITLTEILISILIMGIGVLALATLFPLGLLRLQDANRSTRSVLLTESAIGDVWGRNLLYKPSFFMSWYGGFDPFVQDPVNRAAPNQATDLYFTVGRGLPICYDPLWWGTIMTNNAGTVTPANTMVRFGSGAGYVRSDSVGTPAAYGLQRLTNFPMYFPATSSYYPIDDLAASPDDIIWQEEGVPNTSTGTGSPVVPAMVSGTSLLGPAPLADLRYTWFLTGRQHDVTDGKLFDADVVVCHNRPFATESFTGYTGPSAGNTVVKAAGETAVEGVFGYGPPPGGGGYAPNDTTILLRWPSSMPDPDIRVGGWIADVTYEKSAANFLTKLGTSAAYPYQRCHWYRVAKKSEVGVDSWDSTFRRIVITTAQPVRARTLLNGSGQPVYVNTALVMPSVVNVYSRVFMVRNSGETNK